MNLKTIKRALRFWWQRRTRGFDDSETWSLDYTFAQWFSPRLKRYIELAEPTIEDENHFNGCRKLLIILEQVAQSNGAYDYSQEDLNTLRLLGKILPSLWW